MHCYFAYGLCIHSELALPELRSRGATTAPDVVVQLRPVEMGPCDPAADQPDLRMSIDGTRVWIQDAGKFAVTGGRQILIELETPCDQQMLRINLLGVVMAMLLQQRGLIALHGSAVAIDGAAAVFLGQSGCGKSTTTAALNRRGHPLITDDIAAVNVPADNQPVIFPAFPVMRLWPASAEFLGMDSNLLEPICDGASKRSAICADGFATQPLYIGSIYLMEYGPETTCESISPTDAVAQLLRHSFAAGILRPTGTAPAHFHRCVKLAQSVRIVRLVRRRDMSELDRLAELIEEDLVQSLSRG